MTLANTYIRGTLVYMSPELRLIHSRNKGMGEFNPELSDVFSLGLTFLRLVLNLEIDQIDGMNELKTGE